ncbi:MAG: aminodeoxychorismate synthase component I [Gemmatimonadota bacterium]
MAASSAVVRRLDPSPAPLDLLARLRHLPRLVLLDGAADREGLGRYSYLCGDPHVALELSAADWPEARERIRATFATDAPCDPLLPPFQGGWVGSLSYELGTAFDRMPRAASHDGVVPEIAMALYDWVIAWDHIRDEAWLISTGMAASGQRDAVRAQARAREVIERLAQPLVVPNDLPTPARRAEPIPGRTHPDDRFGAAPQGLVGDFTADDYRAAVCAVIEHILAGDIFQANLSQRFTAPFRGDPLALYLAMRQRAAAPMAAWLAHPQYHVLSASPELFLRFDAATGMAESRPIKGTRPRGIDPASDRALAEALQASAKDRAENLMIVDLVRNDLARVCVPGTVRVPRLCALESHAAVHHLTSRVTGTLAADRDALDLIEAAFPAGSITGAPKLRATELLAAIEPVSRGVYCGAIGWIGRDGSMEFSVAIRTVTLADGRASIHAGGGITALSDPDDEYHETLDKARALVAALAEAQ